MEGWLTLLYKNLPSIILSAFLLAGCTHRWAPHSTKKIGVTVAPLENVTAEPLLNQRLDAIVAEAMLKGGFSSEEAGRTVISGVLTRLTALPLAISRLEGAREYRVQIGATVTIKSVGKEPLTRHIIGEAEYLVRQESLADRSAKDMAIQEAGQEIADQMIAILLGGPTP